MEDEDAVRAERVHERLTPEGWRKPRTVRKGATSALRKVRAKHSGARLPEPKRGVRQGATDSSLLTEEKTGRRLEGSWKKKWCVCVCVCVCVAQREVKNEGLTVD